MDKTLDGHLCEEQLVLYQYGETPEATAIEAHLSKCAGCSAQYGALVRALETVTMAPGSVPEPDEMFEARMWSRIEPRLAPRRLAWRAWLQPQRLILSGAVASFVVAALVAGRVWREPNTLPSSVPTTTDVMERARVRERILMLAVGDHLDRSQMALIEIANAEPNDGPLDITIEQERLRDIVSSNRLLRQTVEVSGDVALASMLDDLERVLLDVAHGPSELDAKGLARIRERIESEGLIFKVRVAGSAVREHEATLAIGDLKIRS